MRTEVTKNILKSIYKKRPLNAKRYDFGLVLVIGGSEFYSGSPTLSAMAAFRSGADMVRIIAPKRAADIIASFSPNLAAYPLNGDWLVKDHLATLLAMTESAKAVSNGNVAVVIGGGLGRSKETQETIAEYISRTSVPIVIDADAIHAIANYGNHIENKEVLFTPHINEFKILTGINVKGVSCADVEEIVRAEAEKLGANILLKGQIDIISDGKDVAIDKAGSPYMTVGGTGDVLAGICGALMSRGVNAFSAAQAGAYINGKAGEIAGKTKTEGLIATDLIETIPNVLLS